METSCTHPASFGGLCALCGAQLDRDQQSAASFAMMHSTTGLKVTEEEASRLDSESTQRLLHQRKLALIVDLDQTIIHATVDPTVAEWQSDPNNPNCEALKGVGRFLLGTDGKAVVGAEVPGQQSDSPEDDDASSPSSSSTKVTSASDIAAAAAAQDGCWYFIKLRPGTKEILKSLSQKIIDPDGSLFGSRILSRDENGSLVQKSLKRLFPMDTSMVVIIDDRADVWNWSPNLVNVRPYDFFVGIGDINATFLPSAPATSPSAPTPTETAAGPAEASAAAAGSDTSQNGKAASVEQGEDESTSHRRRSIAEQEQADNDEARSKATESQKVAVAEQLDARPLARMQEALDEKVAAAEESASPTPLPDPLRENGVSPSSDSDESRTATLVNSVPSSDAGDAEASSPNSLSGAITTQEHTSIAPAAAPPPPHQHAVLRDDDNELLRIQNILDKIHARWFAKWDQAQSDLEVDTTSPHVAALIHEIKGEVLSGTRLAFSGIVPQGVSQNFSSIYRQAQEFGAWCCADIEDDLTHLVIAKPGTAKVRSAQKMKGVKVVWAAWIQDSAGAWERLPEEPYLYVDEESQSDWQSNGNQIHYAGIAQRAVAPPAPQTSRDDGDLPPEAQAELSGFAHLGNGMDWGAADDEVDAFLADGDDEEDDDEEEDDEEEEENDSERGKKGQAEDEDGRTDEEGDVGQSAADGQTSISPARSKSKRQRSPASVTHALLDQGEGDGKRQRVHPTQAGDSSPSTQTSSFEPLTQQAASTTQSNAPSEIGTDEEAMLDAFASQLEEGQAARVSD